VHLSGIAVAEAAGTIKSAAATSWKTVFEENRGTGNGRQFDNSNERTLNFADLPSYTRTGGYWVRLTYNGGKQTKFKVPKGSNIFEQKENLNIKITDVTSNMQQIGSTAKFCHACTKNGKRWGDTCWAVTPSNDNFRQCGCNSGGWAGTGLYYGGYKNAQACGGQGGGFVGEKTRGQQKGNLGSVGLKMEIMPTSAETAVQSVAGPTPPLSSKPRPSTDFTRTTTTSPPTHLLTSSPTAPWTPTPLESSKNDPPMCRNPFISDPESWDCACHEKMVKTCPLKESNSSNSFDAGCYFELLCANPKVCPSWKAHVCCSDHDEQVKKDSKGTADNCADVANHCDHAVAKLNCPRTCGLCTLSDPQEADVQLEDALAGEQAAQSSWPAWKKPEKKVLPGPSTAAPSLGALVRARVETLGTC